LVFLGILHRALSGLSQKMRTPSENLRKSERKERREKERKKRKKRKRKKEKKEKKDRNYSS